MNTLPKKDIDRAIERAKNKEKNKVSIILNVSFGIRKELVRIATFHDISLNVLCEEVLKNAIDEYRQITF